MKSSLTRGHLKAGLDSVRAAKIRSFWTMLGVIIGVTSVITVLAIGQGVRQQVSGQIHHMGKDLLTVRPAQLHPGGANGNDKVSLLTDGGLAGTIRQKDVNAVASTRGVAASAPLTVVTGRVTGVNGNYEDGFVIGTNSSLSSLINQSVAYGSFLTDGDDGSNTAVLGVHASDALFDEDVPLGRSFTFRGQRFVVRGIFNNFSSSAFSHQTNFNNAIFISTEVADRLTNNGGLTYEILAKPSDPDQTAKVAAAVQRSLDKAHGGQSNLTVLQGNQSLAASQDILGLLTRLVAGVAAISLLVGGIGIMNVMLVSVAERTHEIGIRKAVGATNRQILSQFMMEATVLSLAGGVIGVTLAALINVGLRLTTNLQPIMTWQGVVLATGVSLMVGIVFGSVPALKAARRDPIEALRSE
ncbi:MAG TPA: ABC transporter permease [Candidatus Saccharimonadales bacterium]|nr:ABC transporter permease [Candidatus Saccharimonadales bacterium]